MLRALQRFPFQQLKISTTLFTMAGTPLNVPHYKFNDGNEIPVVSFTE